MQDSAEQLKIIPSNSLGSEGTKWKEFNLLPLEQQTKRREKQKSTTEWFASKKKACSAGELFRFEGFSHWLDKCMDL